MTEIKVGDLIKLKWDHPLSIFSKNIVYSNKTMLNNIDKDPLSFDEYPKTGDPDAAYFIDSIKHEECWKYGQNCAPVLYLGSKVLPEIPEKTEVSPSFTHKKIPNVVYTFLWNEKKMYTILGGWKSSKLEDYFYVVNSSKDFKERPQP